MPRRAPNLGADGSPIRAHDSRLAHLALLLFLTWGCAPEIGDCDEAAAISVAFEAGSGAPAYEGQALLIQSCGNGAFCHGSRATDADRFGVPDGLMLDVTPAASDSAPNESEVVRLRRARFRIVQEGPWILEQIDLGLMPPSGDIGSRVTSEAPAYFRDIDGSELPPIGGTEGREIVRNWLACGAPVVERPVPRNDGVAAVVVPGFPVDPIDPTWTSIFENLLTSRGCDTASCHGGSPAETEAGFQVTNSADTHAALVNQPSSGMECVDTGQMLIAEEDPNGSLFLDKLSEATNRCGDVMPRTGLRINATDFEAIRTWISLGAML